MTIKLLTECIKLRSLVTDTVQHIVNSALHKDHHNGVYYIYTCCYDLSVNFTVIRLVLRNNMHSYLVEEPSLNPLVATIELLQECSKLRSLLIDTVKYIADAALPKDHHEGAYHISKNTVP
ncbi:hypothetical protein CEXT_101791 [Caerostris extrusa]|uniref:Uncharacterized protein n=1 Tax=Caerostris extrusa TaxID=172846 RepID=A0AAV4P8E6_CAEEX|nr:hypothetical protein CEXT_101791 [Caerostris extrusa]